MSPKHDKIFSYGGSEVLDIEIRIRLIHGNSTSFVFKGHYSDPYIHTQYHSGLNYRGSKDSKHILGAMQCDHRQCEDCGYYDCKETEKCEWGSESGSGYSKFRAFGPYGVCRKKEKSEPQGKDSQPFCVLCFYCQIPTELNYILIDGLNRHKFIFL